MSCYVVAADGRCRQVSSNAAGANAWPRGWCAPLALLYEVLDSVLK